MALHGERSLQNENSLKRVQETGMIEEEQHQLVSVRASVMIYQVLIMQSFLDFTWDSCLFNHFALSLTLFLLSQSSCTGRE